MSLLVLYQLTHAEVMSSRSVRVRIGPVRNGLPSRMHGFVQPDRSLAQRVVEGIADGSD